MNKITLAVENKLSRWDHLALRWGITKQSGTKPNLVAKILATEFGFVPDC